MRRGLIAWSRTELPESVLDGRVARIQASIAEAKIDALAVYSDPSRSAGASWLSAFVPYWNRGILIVPKSGRPTLLTGMSNRVHGWIKRNAHLADVVYSTDLGGDVGRFVTKIAPGAVIAVPDLSAVPGPVIDGIAVSGASVIDGTTLLARLRAGADPSDLALLFKAASIAHGALATARANVTDAGALIATIDAEARRRGAEEAYIAIAPDLGRSRALYRLEGVATLGERFAVRASVAYKGAWVRMTRTLTRDAADNNTIATEQFAAATALLPKFDGLAGFTSWLVEGCRATQPLEAFAGNMLADTIEIAPGAVVSVQATIDTAHGPVLLGVPVLTGRNGERASLLVPPQFDGTI
jgi:Xaa-Pro aminopeptidase